MAKQISLPALFPIPNNWQWVRIDALTSMKSGFPFDSSRFSPDPAGRMPLIRIRDVVRGSTDTYTDEPCPDEYIINSGDVLIGMDGDFNAAKWKSKKALLNQRVCTIRSVSDQLLNEYLFLFLPDPLKKINDATPSVTVKHLSTKTLGASSIPLPPLPEQQRIVDRIESLFAKLDEAKEKAQAVVDGFELHISQIRKSAFSGELTASWRNRKGKNGQNWPKFPLVHYLELITYGFTNPMPDADEGPWKITAKNVQNGYIDYESARKTTKYAYDNDLTEKSKPLLNDVLLTKDGSIGRVAVVDKEGICINQSVALLRPNELIRPEFLKEMLLSPDYQKMMELQSGGTALKHIYITRVDKMLVSVPGTDEQDEVIRLLQPVFDAEYKALRKAKLVLSQIDTMKKAILARAFRGELGTNDPSEAPVDIPRLVN